MKSLLLMSVIMLMHLNCVQMGDQQESSLTNDGLEERHKTLDFLLQRETCNPSEECSIDRIYQDGSFYFYDAKTEQWSLVTTIKAEGIELLIESLSSVCDILDNPPKNANAEGSLEVSFNTSKCSRRVRIFGVDYGKFKQLAKLSDIINSNLNPIKFD